MKHYFLTASLLTVAVLCNAQYFLANRHLSNLNSTAINVDLLPYSTNKISLGSDSKSWENFYFSGDIYKRDHRFLSADGPGNTFLGNSAGINNAGRRNTAIGENAMFSNTTGAENTVMGYQALYANTESGANTAYGHRALYNTTIGGANDASGWNAMYYNTTGFFNVASGFAALVNNTEGFLNTAIGAFALVQNTTGSGNTAIGISALEINHTTSDNTAIGNNAAGVSLDCSSSTFLGAWTNADSGLTNITALGYQAHATASNQVMVGNTSVTSIGGYANWSNFSDGRYKKNVKEDVPGLEFINQLRPVTYTLDVDKIENTKKGTIERKRNFNIPGITDDLPIPAFKKSEKQQSQELKATQEKAKVVYTGFVAQEVEQAAKKLNYDFSGVDKPKTEKGFYALRYGDFIVPLVKAVQEQQKQIDEQQKQIEELKTLVQSIAKQAASGTTNVLSTAFLKQNAPNPFSNGTVINYYIPENISSAQIIITDMKGGLIRTFSATKGAGQINITSGELSAATYNYTLLINGKRIDTKQMVLTK